MSTLFTFEGIEGSGKSTHAARLAEALRSDGIYVVLTHEPGGTELGRAIRGLLLDEKTPAPTAETELLLYLADRAEHIRRVIRPALERGAVVIADRFSASTLAYQGYGRGLPLEQIEALESFARGNIEPALTFLLDLPVPRGLERARGTGPGDRMEREALAFHERVRAGFHALAALRASRMVRIDASQPLDDVAREVTAQARAHLRSTAG